MTLLSIKYFSHLKRAPGFYLRQGFYSVSYPLCCLSLSLSVLHYKPRRGLWPVSLYFPKSFYFETFAESDIREACEMSLTKMHCVCVKLYVAHFLPRTTFAKLSFSDSLHPAFFTSLFTGSQSASSLPLLVHYHYQLLSTRWVYICKRNRNPTFKKHCSVALLWA